MNAQELSEAAADFAEADAAAKRWKPSFLRDGRGLFPDAPSVQALTARRAESPIATAQRRFPDPPAPPDDMEMGDAGGTTEPPCDCPESSSGGGDPPP